MSTAAIRSRAVGAAGSSGLGRTEATRSGSVSKTTVSAFDQIVALVDGFGLQGVLDPQHPQPEQLASRLNAVDALIRSAEI